MEQSEEHQPSLPRRRSLSEPLPGRDGQEENEGAAISGDDEAPASVTTWDVWGAPGGSSGGSVRGRATMGPPRANGACLAVPEAWERGPVCETPHGGTEGAIGGAPCGGHTGTGAREVHGGNVTDWALE